MCQSFPLFYLRLSCIQSYVYQFQTWISLANPEIVNTGVYNQGRSQKKIRTEAISTVEFPA